MKSHQTNLVKTVLLAFLTVALVLGGVACNNKNPQDLPNSTEARSEEVPTETKNEGTPGTTGSQDTPKPGEPVIPDENTTDDPVPPQPPVTTDETQDPQPPVTTGDEEDPKPPVTSGNEEEDPKPAAPEGVDGLVYKLNDAGTAYTITGIGTCKETNLVIPSVYNGLPVTEIGEAAFYQSKIESVVIPDSVTWIGQRAFNVCAQLVSVTLPKDLSKINPIMFAGCSELKTIVIPVSVTSIDVMAFAGCSKLTTIYYSGSEEQWENIQINQQNNEALKSATIYYDYGPDGVYGLSYALNSDGTGYTVTGIGTCKVTELVIPATYKDLPVTEIGQAAFYQSNIVSVVIPDSVTKIGMRAFNACTALTSVTLPKYLEEIPPFAFAGCSNLKTLVVSVSVTKIGSAAFGGCTGLNIYYSGTETQWKAITIDGSNTMYLQSATFHYNYVPGTIGGENTETENKED